MMPIDLPSHPLSNQECTEEVEMRLSRGRHVSRLRVCPVAMVVAVLVLAATWCLPAYAVEVRQALFPSAEDGVQALITALKAGDVEAVLEVLGPEARPLIVSGDPVTDRRDGDRVVQAYEEAHTLVQSNDTKAVLQLGQDDWPFPIPLVKKGAAWRFDTRAGREELLNRRIGRNELAAIEVCRAYVDAQREYYLRNPQGDALLQYAQQFASTPGKRDGLHWTTKDGEELSPLGPLVARARGEGYKKGQGGKPFPYNGYYYRILKTQGPDAPGGAYDYVVRGSMIGGFALVAYPATWGNSGIMTFIVNHDGIVYHKDLGPTTASVAREMRRFNPDSTWQRL